jgi:hypothetical protein
MKYYATARDDWFRSTEDDGTGECWFGVGSNVYPTMQDWLAQGNIITPYVVPSTIPTSVTRYQARAALLGAGLLDVVNTYFESLPDTSLDKMAWNEAPTVQRNSAAFIVGATTLGLSSTQIDQLFVTAAAIQ